LRELREKCNSITTRSGVVVGNRIGYNLQSKEKDIESEEERKGEERKIDREEKKEEDKKTRVKREKRKKKNKRVHE